MCKTLLKSDLENPSEHEYKTKHAYTNLKHKHKTYSKSLSLNKKILKNFLEEKETDRDDKKPLSTLNGKTALISIAFCVNGRKD